MSNNKGDDVKTLFAHLGLDPEDYRELEGDAAQSAEAQPEPEDNWPHLDQSADSAPEQPQSKQPPPAVAPSVPPRLSPDDEAADEQNNERPEDDYAEDDVIDEVLGDALARRGQSDPAEADMLDAVDNPAIQTQPPPNTPREPEPEPEAAREPVADPEPGPERWSLLSQFDDLAGDPPEATIDGLDDGDVGETSDAEDDWPRSAPDALDPDAGQGPKLVAKAKRLFRKQDTERYDSAEPVPGGRRAEPAGGSEETADEFWDEVAPQAHGNVDIDAVIARAEPAPAAETPPPAPTQKPTAPKAVERPEPEPAPEPEQQVPIRPLDENSALSGVMARLRAGPGPRSDAKTRLKLELDAPARTRASDEPERDAKLSSVFERLKTTRRD